jgi:hypothetical protein
MAEFFEAFKEAVSRSVVEEPARAWILDFVDSHRESWARLRRFRDRVVPLYRKRQAEVRAAWEQRWGPAPCQLTDFLEDAPRRRADMVRWMVERAESPEAFWKAFWVCEPALVEARFEGARYLFARLLESRFGTLDAGQSELLWSADRDRLRECFARFNTASSLAEALQPLEGMLESATPTEVLGE